MPTMTGTVRCLQISEDSAFTRLEDSAGNTETFILWFAPGTNIPTTLNAFTRIKHSMWISQLREAQTNNLNVSITHPDNSAEILTIRSGPL